MSKYNRPLGWALIVIGILCLAAWGLTTLGGGSATNLIFQGSLCTGAGVYMLRKKD